MSRPQNRVVCLISHYNHPAGLAKSLASIGPDEACDVLVVDDGSVRRPLDQAAARAAFRAQGDLEFLPLTPNRGFERALNAGLERIVERGWELVARLDQADQNVPDRFARQTAFLDAHPEVMLVGGAARCVDLAGVEQFVLRPPTDAAAIRREMRFNSTFIHPSVMFRAAALRETGFYPLDAPSAEDYAFFWNFVSRFPTANLPDVLIRYELDPGGLTLSRRGQQLRSRLSVQWRHREAGLASALGIARTLALLAVPDRLALFLRTSLRGGR